MKKIIKPISSRILENENNGAIVKFLKNLGIDIRCQQLIYRLFTDFFTKNLRSSSLDKKQ